MGSMDVNIVNIKKKNTGKVLPPITFSNLIQRNTSVEGTGYLHE